MRALYITADTIGQSSGGGQVTREEYAALKSLIDDTHPIDRLRLGEFNDPFDYDRAAAGMLRDWLKTNQVDLAHFYAGAFPETVRLLRDHGTTVTYTCAAHDRKVSEAAFLELGLPYSFPHMHDGPLWRRYLQGYIDASMVIVPSRVAARSIEKEYSGFGRGTRVSIIPHGMYPAESIPPFPKRFTVGYMGATGPDKGVKYLLQAWKAAELGDSLLLIAGPYSQANMLQELTMAFGGGNIHYMGFAPTLMDFYRQITVYCQPSLTEGFGIEVLEALSHGRQVIASSGVGASEYATTVVDIRDTPAVADLLRKWRARTDYETCAEQARNCVADLTWANTHKAYMRLWSDLLSERSR